MKEIIEIKIKAALGLLGVGTGVAISLSTLEIWLRIGSLLLGMCVGALSAYSIWLTIERKRLDLKLRQKKLEMAEPDTDL